MSSHQCRTPCPMVYPWSYFVVRWQLLLLAPSLMPSKKPISLASQDVARNGQVHRRIYEAFKIATSGRPGPVLVDLPKDVTAGIHAAALQGDYTRN